MTEKKTTTLTLIKETFKKFVNDTPLDYAAIIGFYTIFSLPAVLIIIIRIAGSFFGQEAVRGQVVQEVGGIVGRNSAEQIQNIIENATLSPASGIGTVIGLLTMAFSATTVFIALQDSLNAIWKVKAKPEKGWLKLILNRLLSLALVASLGFLLLVSLAADVLLGILNNYIEGKFSGLSAFVLQVGNLVISIGTSLVIFAAIFKVLPDVKIKWRSVWIGATVTALLFEAGKTILRIYFQFDPLADSYGAAGSLVLILVWVFYTAIIFLLGAEFTQVYAQVAGEGIQPSEHAVRVEVKEIEKEK